jgi:hypothetical protein
MAAGLSFWVFLVAAQSVGDPDIWWHLRNARYLFSAGHLPNLDVYSYTAAGSPWIDHQWLAEIPFYLAWCVGGLMGLYVLYLFLVEALILGIFYLAARESGNPGGALVVSLLGTLLASVTFAPRTILFAYLYLLILLALLYRFRKTGRAPLWALPLLFCLWINTHGTWLLGLAVFGVVVACGLRVVAWGRLKALCWSPQQLKQLLISGAASLGALFVNPYSYQLVFYPFDMAFRQKLILSHLEEWASVNFHDPRGKIVVLVIFSFLLLAMSGNNEWDLAEVMLVLFGLYVGLNHVRFLCLTAILLAAPLAKGFYFLAPSRREAGKSFMGVMLAGVLLFIMGRNFPSRATLEKDLAADLPFGALSYMESHSVSGRIFNYDVWGGYLGWKQPELKVFLDSRGDIFERAGVVKDYLDATHIKDPLEVLDKYQVRYVLMPPIEPVVYVLLHQPNWRILYRDKVSILLERLPGPAGQATESPARTSGT